MSRTIYAAILTLAWCVVGVLKIRNGLSPAMALPAVAVLGAWMAVSGSRAGYLAFALTSIVLMVVMGIMSVFMLAPAALLFMGGKTSALGSVLLTILVMLALSALHFVGLGVLAVKTNAIREPADK